MKPDETVYLRHILDAVAKAETYLHGQDEAAFKQDTLIQDKAEVQKILAELSS